MKLLRHRWFLPVLVGLAVAFLAFVLSEADSFETDDVSRWKGGRVKQHVG